MAQTAAHDRLTLSLPYKALAREHLLSFFAKGFQLTLALALATSSTKTLSKLPSSNPYSNSALEMNGVHYNFTTVDKMKKEIDDGKFVEYA
jgi:hypothetical protein